MIITEHYYKFYLILFSDQFVGQPRKNHKDEAKEMNDVDTSDDDMEPNGTDTFDLSNISPSVICAAKALLSLYINSRSH